MKSKCKAVLVLSVAIALIVGMWVISGNAAGKKQFFFTVTLIVPTGNAPREKAGQVIAQDLEKIGIGVNLQYMDFASITPRWKKTAQTGASYKDGGYDMYLVQTSMNATIDPSGIYQRYACDQFYPNGNNRTRYCNKEFDKLIYQALATPDNQKRWALCQQAEKVLYDDPPVIPLWRPSQFYAINDSVKFPPGETPAYWNTYALRWASRVIPGKTKADMSSRERTLIYAQPTGIDAFLLGYSGSSYSTRAVGNMVYESLIQPLYASLSTGPKDERNLRPALAASWDVSPDGKTWTIHLRHGVTWTDGAPFTADDVTFTFNLLVNPQAGYGSDKFIKEFGITWKKLDTYTVQFTCAKYTPLFADHILGTYILPAHLLSTIPVTELAKSDYNTGKKLVGTGPWILDSYVPGEYIKYKANDNYWGGRPWFDYVVIKFIPQGATAWYALQTGEVDITGRWYGFTHELSDIKKPNSGLYAAVEPSFGPQMIRINNSNPYLSNVWVKNAISLACDRAVMVNVISAGQGVIANQLLPPWSPGHNPNLPPLEFNLNKAKQMMEKAGYDYSTISVPGPTQ